MWEMKSKMAVQRSSDIILRCYVHKHSSLITETDWWRLERHCVHLLETHISALVATNVDVSLVYWRSFNSTWRNHVRVRARVRARVCVLAPRRVALLSRYNSLFPSSSNVVPALPSAGGGKNGCERERRKASAVRSLLPVYWELLYSLTKSIQSLKKAPCICGAFIGATCVERPFVNTSKYL